MTGVCICLFIIRHVFPFTDILFETTFFPFFIGLWFNICSLFVGFQMRVSFLLFFKLNTSYLSNYIQIKIRYDPNHSDAFCFRLFKAVPFFVIMISVTFSHKKQEPPRLKFGACFACTVDSTLQKSCFTHIYEKLLHTHL